MEKRKCFVGIVASGIFSAMGYFVFKIQKDLVFENRGGAEGLDDLIGFLASGGFWLGCGALAWHFVFMLFRK